MQNSMPSYSLAEVYEHSSMTKEATIPAGTMGYLAPFYVYSGVPSQKTDVYSFARRGFNSTGRERKLKQIQLRMIRQQVILIHMNLLHLSFQQIMLQQQMLMRRRGVKTEFKEVDNHIS